MKKTVMFVVLLITVVLAGCDKFLDIKPKGVIIPENYVDYEKLLHNWDVFATSESYPSYMTDDAFLSYEENVSPSVKSISLPNLNLYTFNSVVYTEGEKDYMWEGAYNRIYYYNVIIEDIMNVKDATDAQKQALRAEALVGRALEYLNLVNAYAKHYDKATASSDLAVPLMLDKKVDNKANLERATVQAVYDRVLEDLKEAEQYLPAKSKTPYRASILAGYGVFARTYLYLGDYTKAGEYANKVLAQRADLINMKDYPAIDDEKAIGRTTVPEREKSPENIYLRFSSGAMGLSGEIYGSEDLLNLYAADDMRKKLFFTRKIDAVQYPHDLWAPYLSQSLGITVPEMLLISAECEARMGNKEKAMEQVNKLLEKRVENFVPLTAKDNDEALTLVLKERRKELAFLGLARLIDLKRLNIDPRFAKTITHVTDKGTFTLEPNSPKYVLPIPPNVLKFNPHMSPNERK